EDYRRRTGVAATQVDLVAHGYGGLIARALWQARQDNSFLDGDAGRNFRSAANWGHGLCHKLITLGTPHRGSALANALAHLNANGQVPGRVRELGYLSGEYIDRGGVRDQMILSRVQDRLRTTSVPAHAFIGSGQVELDRTGSYPAFYRDVGALD